MGEGVNKSLILLWTQDPHHTMRALLDESKFSSSMVLALYAFYFYLNQYTPFPSPQYHYVFFRIPLSSQGGSNGVTDSTSPFIGIGYSLQPISIV